MKKGRMERPFSICRLKLERQTLFFDQGDQGRCDMWVELAARPFADIAHGGFQTVGRVAPKGHTRAA